mgnify:CR=1 FL=1
MPIGEAFDYEWAPPQGVDATLETPAVRRADGRSDVPTGVRGDRSSAATDRSSHAANRSSLAASACREDGARPSSSIDRSSGDDPAGAGAGAEARADNERRNGGEDGNSVDVGTRSAVATGGCESGGCESGGNESGGNDFVPGDWVLVPWGSGRRVGLVLECDVEPAIDPSRIRPLIGPLPGAPRADPAWLALGRFAARYYHRPIGEVLLAGVPRLLRTPPVARARGNVFDRARQRWKALAAPEEYAGGDAPPALTDAQREVHAALRDATGFDVHLIHGITGSGKTEVYLHWLADGLRRDPDSQWLLLVPEIGLTPQLVRLLRRRFAGQSIAILHSDLPDGERAAHWLAAAEGRARLIVGTRLAVLTPMPRLAGIVVDEEHDPSYRQQEGIRYSARDLAVALAQQRGVPIALGSATPSLESWLAGQRRRYRLHTLAERPGGAGLPALRIVDVRQPTRQSAAHRDTRGEHGLGAEAIASVEQAVARGEQALIFLNRRGYAPVLHCGACGWISQCDHCSAHRVLHRLGARAAGRRSRAADSGVPRYRLICHHCASEAAVPRGCPQCGNLDLGAVGQGTQRIEHGVRALFPDARVARLDRDVARHRGAAESVLAAAHAGEVDILIGTQMLAKGHDFERLSVVVAIDADSGLYAADYRAPERLFATLMQVAGRAGRSSVTGAVAQVIVQTRFPDHPLFAALTRHDFPGFARAQLHEREQIGLPPYLFQALLRVEARQLDTALAWLDRAKAIGEQACEGTQAASVVLYDPVPMAMLRIANTDRAQLLVESGSRPALHAMVDRWLPSLRDAGMQVAGLRWQLDIDPIEI